MRLPASSAGSDPWTVSRLLPGARTPIMSSSGKRCARRRTATPANPRDTEDHRCSAGGEERHAGDRSCSARTALIRGVRLRRPAVLRSACIPGVTGRHRRRGRRALLSTRGHARPGNGGEAHYDRREHGEDPAASHVERHLPLPRHTVIGAGSEPPTPNCQLASPIKAAIRIGGAARPPTDVDVALRGSGRPPRC